MASESEDGSWEPDHMERVVAFGERALQPLIELFPITTTRGDRSRVNHALVKLVPAALMQMVEAAEGVDPPVRDGLVNALVHAPRSELPSRDLRVADRRGKCSTSGAVVELADAREQLWDWDGVDAIAYFHLKCSVSGDKPTALTESRSRSRCPAP
jgi:hypothetical protein